MPGARLTRTPWLNSAYSKPRSRISRSIARPSVWRWEFQQVESEYIFQWPGQNQKPGAAAIQPHPAMQFNQLQIRVTRREHRGETRDFFLATAPLARLFKMPVSAHDFKRALAVNFFFLPPPPPL